VDSNVDIMQLLSANRTYAWLLGGLIFLGLGMVVGEPVVAALGLASLITAIAAITVKSFMIELIIWAVLSVCLVVVLRGLVPKRSLDLSPDATATVSESIPSGGIGLVSYEGALWKARCQVSDVKIEPGATVHVVGRQGLTLIVLPESFVDEPVDS
jgi:membrane protein implicated in regulation of membrane protease activity